LFFTPTVPGATTTHDVRSADDNAKMTDFKFITTVF